MLGLVPNRARERGREQGFSRSEKTWFVLQDLLTASSPQQALTAGFENFDLSHVVPNSIVMIVLFVRMSTGRSKSKSSG